LGVVPRFCVCGSENSDMKRILHPIYLLAFLAISLVNCKDSSIAPVSAQDKITDLVLQAETQTRSIQTSIDLTAQCFTIENLALSPDYFVDEQHLDPFTQLDTLLNKQPWRKDCNNDFIKQQGFAQCLQNLSLTEDQSDKLEDAIENYATAQQPLLNDEFKRFVDLKSHYRDLIKPTIDSLQRGEMGNDEFQAKIKTYQSAFTEEFQRQRSGNKNVSMLSVNYRSVLESIQSILSESQFKQFYLCHKK
jgi:hypothetical protein